jgi:endonuclease/exonuclease/phosphatase family metal-dependent hydrolase
MRVASTIATLILPTLLALWGCDNSDDNSSNAAAPSVTPPVTLANLNVLHGFDCDPPAPADGDQCRGSERLALLTQHLIAAGCPDVVTLQEIVNKDFVLNGSAQQVGPLASIVVLIEEQLPKLAADCGFTYELVYEPLRNVVIDEQDEELILSRYPVLQTGTRVLYGPLYNESAGVLVFARHVLHTRIDHPSGEVDVYTTHLASGSDFATSICAPNSCPMECNNSHTVRACQAEQLALYVEQTRGADNLVLISGEFNALPGSTEYISMTNRGWLDSHLAAAQPECDSVTGIGCTSGRASNAQDIENPALNIDVRIDYIFVALPQENDSCVASIETGRRGAYTITDAGLFAAEPNPFAAACGSSPAAVCWASDHSGNKVSLTCGP